MVKLRHARTNIKITIFMWLFIFKYKLYNIQGVNWGKTKRKKKHKREKKKQKWREGRGGRVPTLPQKILRGPALVPRRDVLALSRAPIDSLLDFCSSERKLNVRFWIGNQPKKPFFFFLAGLMDVWMDGWVGWLVKII